MIDVKRNRVLLILGMHRSGTSLVSNWINECGINLGNRLLGPASSNRNGHYEDMDFLDLHEQLLQFNGYNSTGLYDVEEIKIDKYFVEKFKSNIELKNKLNDQWGWKEPRTCLFLDFYKNNILDPTFLVLFRDADSVVDSLLRRKFKEEIERRQKMGWRSRFRLNFEKRKIKEKLYKTYCEVFFATWLRYNKELLKLLNSIQEKSFMLVSYKDLLKKDQNVLDWLKLRGFDIKKVSFSEVFNDEYMNSQKKEFDIDSELRNEITAIQSLLISFSKSKSFSE